MSVYESAGVGMAACLVLLCAGVACSADSGGGLWSLRRTVLYGVEGAVLMAEARRGAPDLGYKIAAELRVRTVWTSAVSDHDNLLQFDLLNPKMLMRGKHPNAEYHPVESEWDSYSESSFFVHWNHGLVENIYLDPDELLLFTNFKKALASLFQVQLIDGEARETDISGTCDILYETLGADVIRKIKRRCVWERHATSDSLEDEVFVRRVGRVQVAPGGWVRAAGGEEHAGVGGGGAALKLRAWLRLQERAVEEDAGAPGGAGGDLRAHLPGGLVARGLAMTPPQDPPAAQSVMAAIASAREVLSAVEAAGGGGTAGEARAALRLLPALRAAAAAELRAALAHEGNHQILTPLCRLLALAGTWNAHEAARVALGLRAGGAGGAEGERRAIDYFATLPHAAHVEESVIMDVLRLSTQLPGAVGEAALLGAAGAAGGAAEGVLRAARDHIIQEISKCKSESYLPTLLHALGNLRLADTAPLLLRHAAGGEVGGTTPTREAALRALWPAAVEAGALSARQLAALVRIVLQLDRPAPIQVRALALDAALTAAAVQSSARGLDALPLRLAALVEGLEGGAGSAAGELAELRRYLWARLDALAEQHRAVRRHVQALRRAAPPALLHHYHAGTSSVLSRWAGGEGAGGLAAAEWRARLRSGVLSVRGLLRDAHVVLDLEQGNRSRPLLAVELWARGLAGLVGGGGAGEEEEQGEEVSGALGVAVGGARRGSVSLFESQGALLAAVWGGAGSEPTRVLRAALGAGAHADTLPLSAGAAARRAAAAAGALALDAHGTVSLWSRAARAGVALRAGGARYASISLAGGAGALLEARGEAAAEGALQVVADLDFYSAPPVLCVRASLSPLDLSSNVTVWQRGGGGGRGGGRRWARARRVAGGGRCGGGGGTLALGADNESACRHLAPSDY